VDKKYDTKQKVHTKHKGGKMRVEILLKDVRMKKGYSLQELSRITGISTSHLNYIENNEREPTISMLIRIALALKVDERELYKIIK